MRYAHRGHKVLSVEPDEFQRWAAAGLDDQEVFCPSQAEIMEYLRHTYGPVFVADLIKHLS
jgi:hypothetical protein